MKESDTIKTATNNINTLYSNSDELVLRNNHVFEFIKKNAPISPYKIAKEMKVSYTTIKRIIRNLEYCGLIKIKVILTDENRTCKMIIIPEEILEEEE